MNGYLCSNPVEGLFAPAVDRGVVYGYFETGNGMFGLLGGYGKDSGGIHFRFKGAWVRIREAGDFHILYDLYLCLSP